MKSDISRLDPKISRIFTFHHSRFTVFIA